MSTKIKNLRAARKLGAIKVYIVSVYDPSRHAITDKMYTLSQTRAERAMIRYNRHGFVAKVKSAWATLDGVL